MILKSFAAAVTLLSLVSANSFTERQDRCVARFNTCMQSYNIIVCGCDNAICRGESSPEHRAWCEERNGGPLPVIPDPVQASPVRPSPIPHARRDDDSAEPVKPIPVRPSPIPRARRDDDSPEPSCQEQYDSCGGEGWNEIYCNCKKVVCEGTGSAEYIEWCKLRLLYPSKR